MNYSEIPNSWGGLMGIQIIKQPNGLYAAFSSYVDDFIMLDARPEQIVEELGDNAIGIMAAIENGERPYFQFTLSFDEAVKKSKEA